MLVFSTGLPATIWGITWEDPRKRWSYLVSDAMLAYRFPLLSEADVFDIRYFLM